jgi:hypothetical protein
MTPSQLEHTKTTPQTGVDSYLFKLKNHLKQQLLMKTYNKTYSNTFSEE